MEDIAGNKLSLSALMVDDDSPEVLKQLVRDRYCVPEGMNLVMISNGESGVDAQVITAFVLY